MTHHRDRLRAELRAAFNASPRFGAWTKISIWAKAINASDLPAYGFGITGEAAEADAFGSSQRRPALVIVVKRFGVDLEDLEAADAAEIEALIEGLWADDFGPELVETTYSEDAQGEAAVSTLALRFQLTTWAE